MRTVYWSDLYFAVLRDLRTILQADIRAFPDGFNEADFSRLAAVISDYLSHGKGVRCIGFGMSIKHRRKIAFIYGGTLVGGAIQITHYIWKRGEDRSALKTVSKSLYVVRKPVRQVGWAAIGAIHAVLPNEIGPVQLERQESRSVHVPGAGAVQFGNKGSSLWRPRTPRPAEGGVRIGQRGGTSQPDPVTTPPTAEVSQPTESGFSVYYETQIPVDADELEMEDAAFDDTKGSTSGSQPSTSGRRRSSSGDDTGAEKGKEVMH